MIAKIHKSAALKNTISYVFQASKDADIVDSNTSVYDRESAYRELSGAIAQRPGIKAPVSHTILSVPEHDTLSREQWGEVAQKYMEKMGYAGCPYVAVEHHDTRHHHVHIVASRIDMTGRLVSDSHERYRAQEVMRELEKEYGLERVRSSWEPTPEQERKRAPEQAEYHAQRRTGQASTRNIIRGHVADALLSAPQNMSQLAQELEGRGVRLVPKVTRDGERVRGVYFEHQGVRIAGSKVARAYSWGKLTKEVEYDKTRDLPRLVAGPESHGTKAPEAAPTRTGSKGVEKDSALRLDPSLERSNAPLNRLPTYREPTVREQELSSLGSPQTGAAPSGRDVVKARVREAVESTPQTDWKGWSQALREKDVTPVPKASVGDVHAFRGMYFDSGGETFKASEVSRASSYGGLVGSMGEPSRLEQAQAFASVEVPGQGRHPYRFAPEKNVERVSQNVGETLPGGSRDRVLDAYARKLEGTGRRLVDDREMFEGRWVGVLVASDSTSYGVVANEGAREAMLVRLGEKTHLLAAHQSKPGEQPTATRVISDVGELAKDTPVVVRQGEHARAVYAIEPMERERPKSELERLEAQYQARGVSAVRVAEGMSGQARGALVGVLRGEDGERWAMVHDAQRGRVLSMNLSGQNMHLLKANETLSWDVRATGKVGSVEALELGREVVLKTSPDARALYVIEGRAQEAKTPSEPKDKNVVDAPRETTVPPKESLPRLGQWLDTRAKAGRPVELLSKGEELTGDLSKNTLQTREGTWRALTGDNGRVVLAPDTPQMSKLAGGRVQLRHGHDGAFYVSDRSKGRGMDR